MSTDWTIVCDRCKASMHAGQHMGGRPSLGYGTNDVEGAGAVAKFIDDHYGCAPLRIMDSEATPDEYRRIEYEELV